MIRAAALALVMLFAFAAGAVEPDEMLANPAQEARAREISKRLRCLVCQNQSIDDSNAGLARDLRMLVRQRIQAGDSDDTVIAFVVARYGDFVLLRPPVRSTTIALWFGPILIFLAAAFGVLVYFRRRRGTDAAKPLSPAERKRLAKILDGDGET